MAETKLWLVDLGNMGGGPATQYKVAAPDAWGALIRARGLDGGVPRERVSVGYLATASLDDGPVPVTVTERLAALEADVAGLKGK
jgi:hypothetical protein